MSKRESEGNVTPEIHWEMRWLVVSIYKVTKTALANRGNLSPTQEDIVEHIRKVKQSQPAWEVLQKRAKEIRKREKRDELARITGRKETTMRDASKAFSNIQNKYRVIESDLEESYSFLDEVIFNSD